MRDPIHLDEPSRLILDLILQAEGRDDAQAVIRELLEQRALESTQVQAVLEQELHQGLDSGEPKMLDDAYLTDLTRRMRERIREATHRRSA
ncbi:MAG: hypothetical protein RLN76_12320 [Phycisphaeraceae bacterium]